MAGKITKYAFEKLIVEDIEWLKKQPRTLERDHVVGIVQDSVKFYYSDADDIPYTTDELFRLIGEVTGYGPTTTSTKVTYNPARRYNGFGESEGLDYNDWGYSVSTKLCSTDDITVDAQHKDLRVALWMLAQAVVSKFESIGNKWKERAVETREKFNKFIEQSKAHPQTGKTPYRD